MKRIMIVAALVALSGCASMEDLRNSPPAKSYTSKKDTSEISTCILQGWQKNSVRYGEVFIQPHPKGYTVYTPSSTEVADVLNEGGKVEVNFYHQGGLFDSRISARTEVIEGCI